MRLESADGQVFELRIVGYQFPEERTDPYDSNWLLMRVSAVAPRGSWSFLDPCLLTDEVAGLADWFEEIASGRPTGNLIEFIEPNLVFSLIGEDPGRRLYVHFDLASGPPWARLSAANGGDSTLRFLLTEIDLREAAISLRSQLAVHPQRGDP